MLLGIRIFLPVTESSHHLFEISNERRKTPFVYAGSTFDGRRDAVWLRGDTSAKLEAGQQFGGR